MRARIPTTSLFIVVFDLDGTLVEIIPRSVKEKFFTFSKEYLSITDQYKLEACFSKTLDEWKIIKKDLPGRKKYLELWKMCFRNLEIDDPVRAAYALQKEIEEKCEDQLYPDVIPLLQKLRNEKLPLGIFSERPLSGVKAALVRHGILHYFDFYLSAYDLDPIETKLNGKVWEALIKEVSRYNPHKIYYIGDIYEVDIIPALSYGIIAILLDRKGKYHHINHNRINSLDKLYEFLFL
jgi:FMN phosphatase YigB (HAD superfamily)